MEPALDHHYANNSHHPQHYENGVDGMDLFDIVEMFFDWKAAGERTKDGDIFKSININKERFGLSEQLVKIFENTARKFLGEKKDKYEGYRKSGMYDSNGIEILEGSVIDADGYTSDLEGEEKSFHCVEYYEGSFGSDIYSDFEPLSTYKTITVRGHAEDYRDLYESGDWSGNLGAGLK